MSKQYQKSIHGCNMMIIEWERQEYNRIMTSELTSNVNVTREDIEREVNIRKKMFGLI